MLMTTRELFIPKATKQQLTKSKAKLETEKKVYK